MTKKAITVKTMANGYLLEVERERLQGTETASKETKGRGGTAMKVAMEPRITSVRNAQGIKVKRCCASCQHKYVEKDGSRTCQLMMLTVAQKFRCKQWQMSDGLKRAGITPAQAARRVEKI